MATTRIMEHMIKHPYVMRKKGVSGGKPIVQGTRIKVAQIAIEYERMGWTPDEIVQAHPHLTLPQVHDALSYYYSHLDEINADIHAGERIVEAIRRQHPRSVLESVLKFSFQIEKATFWACFAVKSLPVAYFQNTLLEGKRVRACQRVSACFHLR